MLSVSTGRGPEHWQVLGTETGDVEASFDLPRAVTAYQSVWEDEMHLIAVASCGEDSCLVRVGLDGSVERVTRIFHRPPYDGNGMVASREQGFVFAVTSR